jgi:hypothetical protein
LRGKDPYKFEFTPFYELPLTKVYPKFSEDEENIYNTQIFKPSVAVDNYDFFNELVSNEIKS